MYQIQLSLPLWIKEEEGEVFILLQFCSPKCEIIELVIFLFVRLFFVFNVWCYLLSLMKIITDIKNIEN